MINIAKYLEGLSASGSWPKDKIERLRDAAKPHLTKHPKTHQWVIHPDTLYQIAAEIQAQNGN